MVKEIAGFEGLYTISDTGRITNMKTGKIKNQLLSNAGYYRVHLFKNGKGKICTVHRLVAQAFCPNPQNLPCVNHIDGNKLNNKSINLEWVSHSDNNKEAVKLGLAPSGANRYNSCFTEEQIVFLHELYELGYSKTKLSKIFGVNRSTMTAIINKKTYKKEAKYQRYSEGRHFSPQVIEIIKSLLNHGFTYNQIAEMCSLNKSALRDYYRNHYLLEMNDENKKK